MKTLLLYLIFTSTTSFGYNNLLEFKKSSAEPSLNVFNEPPVANDDFYTVIEGGVFTVPADGVLANDIDPDTSDVLTVISADTVSTGLYFLKLKDTTIKFIKE